MEKRRRLALQSLLAIVGILICGLSHGSLLLLLIGGVVTFIGGFSLGSLIALNNKK